MGLEGFNVAYEPAALPTMGSKITPTNSLEICPLSVNPLMESTSHSAVTATSCMEGSMRKISVSYEGNSHNSDDNKQTHCHPHTHLWCLQFFFRVFFFRVFFDFGGFFDFRGFFAFSSSNHSCQHRGTCWRFHVFIFIFVSPEMMRSGRIIGRFSDIVSLIIIKTSVRVKLEP